MLKESLRKVRPVANHGTSAYSGKTGNAWVSAAMEKWGELVECTQGFAPIKNNHTKAVTAALLDNQLNHYEKLLESAPALNTSMLGPQYGMTGGALHAADTFAPGDFRNPVMFMPVIRRVFPELIANDTVGVQPMPNSSATCVALRYKYLRGANVPADSSVHHVHDSNGKTADGSYDARGLRGIHSTYKYDAGLQKIVLVDTEGRPTIHDVAYATPANSEPGKWVGHVSPFVLALLSKSGDKDYSQPTKEMATAEAAIAKAKEKVEEIFKKIPKEGLAGVGISQSMESTPALNGLNDEIGFHRIDTRFTGRANDQLAQSLAGGRWKFRPEDTGVAAWVGAYEATAATARTSFDYIKATVEAGTRKIATSWTPELEEDLRNNSGIDINEQGLTHLAYELTAEIDRELVVRMLWAALSKKEFSLWSGENADARWAGERARALYMDLIKCSIRMQTRNHRGPANFIICSPDVAAALEGLQEFVQWPADSNIATNNMAATKAGTLGGNRFTVYIDTKSPIFDSEDYGYGYESMFDQTADSKEQGMPNYAMLGYKGSESFDAGIIFCPYIPIMMHSATDPYSFSEQRGLSTRYGIVDNIFGAELYYHVVIIDSLTQPGIDPSIKKYFPAGYVPASVVMADNSAWQNVNRPTGFAVPVKAEISGSVSTQA